MTNDVKIQLQMKVVECLRGDLVIQPELVFKALLCEGRDFTPAVDDGFSGLLQCDNGKKR